MPRLPRSAIGDVGIFHIYCRGNNKKKVFHDNEDLTRFKKLVLQAKNKHGIYLFDYSLMPNHYHFQLESQNQYSLSRAFQYINQRYSVWHKNKYGGLGHLWQGRFKNKLITSETHFWICRSYIEANAVKAGLCESIEDYKWSSYMAHALGVRDSLVDFDSIYLSLGATPKERQEAHQKNIELYLSGRLKIDEYLLF